MAVYVVSRVSILDVQAMQQYIDQVVPIVEAFGGRYLVRGSNVRAIEGQWESDRMVVLEFPDEEGAMKWYHSAEYRPLRDLRQRSSQAVILLAEGLP
jgi:uncharacterized protein (DUF1330 family)